MRLLKGNTIAFWFTISLLFLPLLDLAAQQRPKVRGTLSLTSPDFDYGDQIPTRNRRNNLNVFPALTISNVPPKARSFVIKMIDTEGRFGSRIHWLIANIPASCRILTPETIPQEAVTGTNDFGHRRYDGPAAPSGIRHYLIHILALDITLPELKPGFSDRKLQSLMWGHILEEATLMGTFSRHL